MALIAYLNNDHIIQLKNLQDQDGNDVTTATVTAEILDSDDNQVSGVSQPITLSHQSGGTYEGTLDEGVSLNESTDDFFLRINADDGSANAEWKTPLNVKVRE